MPEEPARHDFVSDTLGLPGFPHGTEPWSDGGDHVMGAVVFAWLTDHPLTRWGPDWARSGSLTARFRRHLTAPLPLTAEVFDHGDSIDLRVVDRLGVEVYATGIAHAPDATNRPSATQVAPTGDSQPLRPQLNAHDLQHQDQANRTFHPLTFEFDAHRDLLFTKGLTHGELWRSHGWAHPAWLASATNAIVRRNVSFATPDTWTNAGLTLHQHEPITDGSTITLSGGVRETFDGGRNRFAVAALTAWVDATAVASIDNTFVYETLDPESPGAH